MSAMLLSSGISAGIEGKVIAITEAGSGIGAAAAALLAAHGAHVMLGGRRPEQVAAQAATLARCGGSVRHQVVDVTDRRDTQRFISLAHAWFGRLDGIVNSAGVMALSRLESLCIDDWDRMIDVNLRGTLHGIAAGLPLLLARGRGQIINIAARGRVLPGAAVHGATQQAMRALTEGLRRELGGEASPLRITLIALATNGYEDAGRWVDAGAQAIADAVARAHLRDADELVVRCFGETPMSFGETLIRAKSADQRFPASSSGSWAFFGENGARPRSSGANLN